MAQYKTHCRPYQKITLYKDDVCPALKTAFYSQLQQVSISQGYADTRCSYWPDFDHTAKFSRIARVHRRLTCEVETNLKPVFVDGNSTSDGCTAV